ncbi:hypothetical protein C2845_PM03G28930 [Panicum miliaceum]|uniref:Uncharacterized protein n=1 Tax=Panicum miliaceum TaxID=4540 RepID=A0A3L6TGC2_PANMI|nr:hypothetical protein C2845_PM03G28930 [Panicum miliaceum]
MAEAQGEGEGPLQLGFVHLVEPSQDPVFSSFSRPPKNNAEAIRLWAQFLAPGSSQTIVSVPNIWADFFTAMLVNPASFSWAKQMLSSPAWDIISGRAPDGVQFALPDRCPQPSLPCLKDLPAPENLINTPDKKGKEIASAESNSPGSPLDQLKQKISSSSGPWSKALLDQAEQAKFAHILEDQGKRRSLRMPSLKNGFRDSQCTKKGCLGCIVDPPALSPSVIRNLGTSFCKIDEDSLTDVAFNKKKKVSAPGGKKPIKKKPNSKDDVDAKQDNKKPKK